MSAVAVGAMMRLHSRAVVVRSAPRRIAGGEVVSVAWVDDDRTQLLPDGSVHPAHRAGWHWEEPTCNLREPIGGVVSDAIARLRALATRLAGAPEYTQERAIARCPDGPLRGHRNAFQAGALEQICRSSADEIALIIRQLETP